MDTLTYKNWIEFLKAYLDFIGFDLDDCPESDKYEGVAICTDRGSWDFLYAHAVHTVYGGRDPSSLDFIGEGLAHAVHGVFNEFCLHKKKFGRDFSSVGYRSFAVYNDCLTVALASISTLVSLKGVSFDKKTFIVLNMPLTRAPVKLPSTGNPASILLDFILCGRFE